MSPTLRPRTHCKDLFCFSVCLPHVLASSSRETRPAAPASLCVVVAGDAHHWSSQRGGTSGPPLKGGGGGGMAGLANKV
jgi:hypothetical protein